MSEGIRKAEISTVIKDLDSFHTPILLLIAQLLGLCDKLSQTKLSVAPDAVVMGHLCPYTLFHSTLEGGRLWGCLLLQD